MRGGVRLSRLRAATTAGPRAEAASTHRRDAPSETRPKASQKVSRYSRVCPAPTQASPRFDDQRSEANVHAVKAAKSHGAALPRTEPAPRRTPVSEAISASAARTRVAGAHWLT